MTVVVVLKRNQFLTTMILPMLLLKLPQFRVNIESLAEIPLPDFLTALWKVSVKKKKKNELPSKHVSHNTVFATGKLNVIGCMSHI